MAQLLREYRYRQLFPMTHEQYLDEPLRVVEWMMTIDNVWKEVVSSE